MFSIRKERNGKAISESAIQGEKIKLFSEHITTQGVIYGGRVLEVIESYALTVAEKHSEAICKRSSVDFVRVSSSAKKEDILICHASITRAWRSSMEVGVKVVCEDFRSLEQKDIISAYFTFDAFDKKNDLKDIATKKASIVTERDLQMGLPINTVEKKIGINIEH